MPHAPSEARNAKIESFLKAAEKGYVQQVEQFLKDGMSVDTQSIDLETALMRASSHGKLEVVELLLKHDADVHLTNQHGDTALHEAFFVEGSQSEVVLALLRARADPNATNDRLRTPFFMVTQQLVGEGLSGEWGRGCANDMLQMLNYGANWWVEDSRGQSPIGLMMDCLKEHPNWRVETLKAGTSEIWERAESEWSKNELTLHMPEGKDGRVVKL